MMRQCQNIVPLLYLFRDGELSAPEMAKVADHVRTCSHCRKILEELHSIDAALAPMREIVPEMSSGTSLVDETMERIAEKTSRARGRLQSIRRPVELFGWLRPVPAFLALAAVALFTVQQSRDTAEIMNLEKRLRASGSAAMSADKSTGADAIHLLGRVVSQRQEAMSPSVPFSSDAVMDAMAELMRSGLGGLLRQDNGLFQEFARRYPELSAITPGSRIDEKERRILTTEGKAFLQEFQQLLREGEKQ